MAELNKELRLQKFLIIIQIISIVTMVVITGLNVIRSYETAKSLCDISSYPSYVNSKVFCDQLDWRDIKDPSTGKSFNDMELISNE